MEIARKVQVDLLHRQHLGITATSSSPLDAEAGTERRLTQSDCSFLANLIKTQRQTNADGGLTNTRLRRTDSGHQDQTALLDLFFINERYRHLGHITSIRLYLLGGDS